MTKLSESAISEKMESLTKWKRESGSGGITRLLEFESFADGIEFVNRVAKIADEHDHHPDIDIRYRRVKLTLISHDVGGLSSRDFRMAKLIDKLI